MTEQIPSFGIPVEDLADVSVQLVAVLSRPSNIF
jgi:hypothetical protein